MVGGLFQLLEFIVRNITTVYIILDGVDKALPENQEKLLSSFVKLSVSCGTLLNL